MVVLRCLGMSKATAKEPEGTAPLHSGTLSNHTVTCLGMVASSAAMAAEEWAAVEIFPIAAPCKLTSMDLSSPWRSSQPVVHKALGAPFAYPAKWAALGAA